jgi:hypothetical protein
MSEQIFEVLSPEEWKDEGGGGSAERGLYSQILATFVESEQRYAKISTEAGRFAGKQASTIATALKNARDGKNAADALQTVKVSSRGGNKEKGTTGTVFLENTAVEA